jgi:hypothetical protein
VFLLFHSPDPQEVKILGSEAVAFDLEALQVPGNPQFLRKGGRPEPSRLLPALDGQRVTICPLHVAGSGTGKAVGSVGQSSLSTCGARASRKPRLLFRLSGVFLLWFAARQFPASLFQLPPRITRFETLDRSPTAFLAPRTGIANWQCPLSG